MKPGPTPCLHATATAANECPSAVAGPGSRRGDRLGTLLSDCNRTSPTTLRAKVWAASQPQPALWFVAASDATATLQAAGHTGIAALLSATTTNGPVKVSVDDYSVTSSP